MIRQLFQYDPVIGYRFIPGLKSRVDHESGGYLVRVNQAGFRCEHEVTAEKTPGTFRVLLFGDSYTAGHGVSNKYRYGEILEQLVPGLQVLNFGLPGTATDQQYLTFSEVSKDLQYDLVVIAVLVENIRRNVSPFQTYNSGEEDEQRVQAKPYFTLDDGRLMLHHQPVPKEPLRTDEVGDSARATLDRGGRFPALRNVINTLGLREVAQRVSQYQPLPEYDRSDNPAWRLTRAILERFAGESRTPVVVMPLPLYQHVEETASARGYQARFAELHQPPRVIVHDPLPDFLRTPRAERRGFRFEHDVHPTPAGHRIIAESLAPVIRRMKESG